MRIRTAAITIGTALVGAAAAVTISAGTASAFVPIINQDSIIIGAGFDHNETAALANSPIPALVDNVLPQPSIYILDPATQLPRNADHTRVYADLPTVFNEAAAAPDGRMAVAIVDPSANDGHNSMVLESLN